MSSESIFLLLSQFLKRINRSDMMTDVKEFVLEAQTNATNATKETVVADTPEDVVIRTCKNLIDAGKELDLCEETTVFNYNFYQDWLTNIII